MQKAVRGRGEQLIHNLPTLGTARLPRPGSGSTHCGTSTPGRKRQQKEVNRGQRLQLGWVANASMLSERSQPQEASCSIVHLCDVLSEAQPHGHGADPWLPKGRGRTGWQRGSSKTVLEVGELFCILVVVLVTQLCTHQNLQNCSTERACYCL